MNIFKTFTKFILPLLFVIIFFSTLHAKKPSNLNSKNSISNYFSGILLLEDDQYEESYKFLKNLEGLEENHINFSSKYLFSLINLGKFKEAFNFSKKLEKKNLNNFESNLVIGVYYLKEKKYNLAQKYFTKLKKNKSQFVLNNFVSDSLLIWSSLNEQDFLNSQIQINAINPELKNLTKIQNVFLNCFYNTNETKFYFEKLLSNEKVDFSRYNFFYTLYLINTNQNKKANNVVNTSLELYPNNLLLNQLKLDLTNGNFKSNFNCKNSSHVASELLYITANALATQQMHSFSNFYLNLAKYLNQNFYSFNILLAENFYKLDNFKGAKKIYDTIATRGEAYFWYASKQKANILILEKKPEKALNFLTSSYKKLQKKTIYSKYDFARFLKNNDKFENAIEIYSDVLLSINKDHPLYPKIKDGRGVSYERIGKWEKAEKDLLSSLSASPDQAYVINYLAYSWIEQGVKIKEALKMLEKANNIKSNDPYIIDSLGWALFKLKKYEDSKKFLQSAVKLMPADPIVNDHYGDVLWKNGKKIQARYYWNYVLSLEETEEELKNKIKNKLLSGL